MKALLVNGSPHANGSTYTALHEVEKSLSKNGIETEIYQIGGGPVRGCVACGGCKNGAGCVFDDDCANELADKMAEADAIVVGSPVYYSGPNGALTALLDRVFYSRGKTFAYKPAAAVVSCRRSGATASFDRLNKYFTINSMYVVGSGYWNNIHGNSAAEAKEDLEGLQTMRRLGENMAYLLKISAAEKGKIQPDVPEQPIATNFIR